MRPTIVLAISVATAPGDELRDALVRGAAGGSGDNLVRNDSRRVRILVHRAVVVVLRVDLGLRHQILAGLIEDLHVALGVVRVVRLVVVLDSDVTTLSDGVRDGVVGVAALVAAVVGHEARTGHVGHGAHRTVRRALHEVERHGRELDLVLRLEATGGQRRLPTDAGCRRAADITTAHREDDAVRVIAEEREVHHLVTRLLLITTSEAWLGAVTTTGGRGQILRGIVHRVEDGRALGGANLCASKGCRQAQADNGVHRDLKLLIRHWRLAPVGWLMTRSYSK